MPYVRLRSFGVFLPPKQQNQREGIGCVLESATGLGLVQVSHYRREALDAPLGCLLEWQ